MEDIIESRINVVKADYGNATKYYMETKSLFRSGLDFNESDNLQKLIGSCRLCYESLFCAFENIMKILVGELEEPQIGKGFPSLISLSRALHKISVGLRQGPKYPNRIIDYSYIRMIELDKIVTTKEIRNDLSHNGIIREARHFGSLFSNLKQLIRMVDPSFDENAPTVDAELGKETFGHFIRYIDFEDIWTPPARILVIEPVWSIPDDQVSLLLSLGWDAIIDLDGRGIGFWETASGKKSFGLKSLSRMEEVIKTSGYKSIPLFAISPDESSFSIVKTPDRIPYLNYSDGDISLNRDREQSIDVLNMKMKVAIRNNEKKDVRNEIQGNLDIKKRKINAMHRFIKEFLSRFDSAVVVCLAEAFVQDNSAQQIIYEIAQKVNMDIQVVLVQDALGGNKPYPDWIDESMCMTWNCELRTFFYELYKNRVMFMSSPSIKKENIECYRFLLRDSVSDRKKEESIPTNGIIKEVEDYFELLHLYIGNETTINGEEMFYRGHLAEWSTFKFDCDANIAPKTKEDLTHKIRSSFTTDPERENTYYILHDPGAGGTTLGRRIAWDIHKDFPVAVLKRFDNKLTSNRIESLYRVLENTPFLILADTAHGISDEDIDDFIKLMKYKSLPIVALIVQRKQSSKKVGRNVYTIPRLEADNIKAIKDRCMRSALHWYETEDEMIAHVDELDNIKKTDQTPMIINMFIMDRNFKSPEQYVRSFINKDALPENVLNVLKFVSFYSMYTERGLPIKLLTSVYNASTDHQESKAFKSIMLSFNRLLLFESREKSGPPESVRCIHTLFAEEILRWLDGNSWENNLVKISESFLDYAMNVITDSNITECISWLFARRNRNYYEETSGKMTKLIQTVMEKSLKSAGAELLEGVAKRIADYICDNRVSIDDDACTTDYSHIINLSARLWAQCARFYRNSENYDENKMDTYTELSLKALSKEDTAAVRGFQDIYHMAGMCWEQKLKNLFENAPSDISEKNIDNAKRLFETTIEYYEKSVQLGNFDYCLPSIMSAYALVIKHIYNMLDFINDEYRPDKLDNDKFSWVLSDVIEDANRLIDDIEQYDLTDDAMSIFDSHANSFRNTYMLENNSKLLQDLNNYIDRMNNSSQEHPISLQQAYAQRVYYILNKYYDKKTKRYNYLSLYKTKDDLEKVLTSIESALEYSGRKQNYLYKIWFKLAKLDDVSFSKAKQRANDWAGIIGTQKRISRQKLEVGPFYYMYIISLLSKQPYDSVKKDWDLLQKNSNRDEINRNEEWILDYYTTGKTGLGCLVDREWAPYEGIRDNNAISWITGRITHISEEEIIGGIDIDESVVDLRKNQHKSEGQVFFKPRTADITINQRGEEMEFKFGFTLSRIRAVDSTMRVRKSHEWTKIKDSGHNLIADIPEEWVRFTPSRLNTSKYNGSPNLLIGYVGQKRAALHISDIQKYPLSDIADIGNASDVLLFLARIKTFYVTITKSTEKGLELSLFSTGQILRDIIGDCSMP